MTIVRSTEAVGGACLCLPSAEYDNWAFRVEPTPCPGEFFSLTSEALINPGVGGCHILLQTRAEFGVSEKIGDRYSPIIKTKYSVHRPRGEDDGQESKARSHLSKQMPGDAHLSNRDRDRKAPPARR